MQSLHHPFSESKLAYQLKICLLLVILAAMLHFFHLRLMHLIPNNPSNYLCRRFIPKPQLARAVSLGYDRVMADFYWLMFAQYYGDKSCVLDKFRYAPDYLRVIISLDPHFLRPYWFTAFVLAGDMVSQCKEDNNAEGVKKCLEEAKSILDKGIDENPDDWNLPYIAGFSQYLFAKNATMAAHYYRLAAKVPGAPTWLDRQAKIMESGVAMRVSGEAKTWAITYYTTRDNDVKEHARKELQVVWSQIYYMAAQAKLERIRLHALEQLSKFDVKLLAQENLPRIKETAPAENEILNAEP